MLILAQFRLPFDPENLIYVAILLLSVLGGLAKTIIDKLKESQAKREAERKAPGGPMSPTLGVPTATKVSTAAPEPARRLNPSDAEVILAELFDIPVERRRPPKPAPPPPQTARAQPPAPAAPAYRPSPPARPKRARPQHRAAEAPAHPQPPQPSGKKRQQTGAKPQKLPAPVAVTPPPPEPAMVSVEKPGPLALGDLRRAVVLSEILAPPIALRAMPHTF